jgi:diguanylate cyclase (GGDEF)-like protein
MTVEPSSRPESTGRGPGRPVDTAALARVLDEFTSTVTGDFSVDHLLRQLAVGATQVLELDGAGVMAPGDGPGDPLIRLAFATNGPAHDLELLQERTQSGPCRDSMDSGRVINIAHLGEEGDWPTYQAKAVELEIHSVATIPLRARHRSWGVLDLYRCGPLPLSEEELRAAVTLANLATSYIVVTHDRDVALHAQDELADRAMHDMLTGLPVRWVFLDHLGRALSRLPRTQQQVAVLFLDLDGLKYVNDTLGHLAGDQLISTCVQRVQAALRPSDVLARIGGDEFVVLLEELSHPDEAQAVAERVLDHLAQPYRVEDGRTIVPTASVGIATTDNPATPAATLIAHADSAMYQAKKSGRGRAMAFDAHSYATARAASAERDLRAVDLNAALGGGDLEVHYQPIVELAGRAAAADVGVGVPGLLAVEALVRWRHRSQGLLSAAAFIDTAERSGLLPELGELVLRTACRQLAAWQRDLGDAAPSRVFVNLSPSELGEPLLARSVERALEEAGLDAARLTLEITETGLFDEGPIAGRNLESLRALGCGLAIDDFGTGYSSLSRLAEVPADVIKVDRSFSRDLSANASAAAVVSAVVTLGANLDRMVIVEGVEDEETLQGLQRLGVTHVQGYHLGRPVAPEVLTGLLGGDRVGRVAD